MILKDKVVVVVGATGGMGSEVCKRFADEKSKIGSSLAKRG